MKTFEQWKSEVNEYFEDRLILGCDELPDWNYYDCYELEMTPDEVFDEWAQANYPGWV